jgi:hypothetical protein
LVIKAELPGVSKDDVSVEVHQNTLTLRGQRKHEAEVKQDKYHRVERSYGTFQRCRRPLKMASSNCTCHGWKARNRGGLRLTAKR